MVVKTLSMLPFKKIKPDKSASYRAFVGLFLICSRVFATLITGIRKNINTYQTYAINYKKLKKLILEFCSSFYKRSHNIIGTFIKDSFVFNHFMYHFFYGISIIKCIVMGILVGIILRTQSIIKQ